MLFAYPWEQVKKRSVLTMKLRLLSLCSLCRFAEDEKEEEFTFGFDKVFYENSEQGGGIDDIDGTSSDPFVAAAVANERELNLSEEQKGNYRKDVSRKIDEDGVNICNKDNEVGDQTLKSAMLEGLEISNGIDNQRIMSNGAPLSPDSTEARGSKRSNESDELNIDNKRSRTIILDSDDEASMEDTFDRTMINSEDPSYIKENICVFGDDGLTSHSLNKKLQCTACNKLSTDISSHPLMRVIICANCKRLLEEKMRLKVVHKKTS